MMTISSDSRKFAGWPSLQFVGLTVANVPACIAPLFFDGYHSEQTAGVSFSGKVELIVNQGGLRNRSATDDVKQFFKSDVMPSLVNSCSEISRNYTGKLALHFRDGILLKVNLTTH